MPHNLLTDRAHRRHQKAVDVNSGAVVGYARWILPDTCAENTPIGLLDILWSTAQIPTVSQERVLEAKREFDAADWSFDHTMEELDPLVIEMRERLMKQKMYLGELVFC